MMNTKKSSARSIWKYLFILPLLGFSMMSLNTVNPEKVIVTPIPVDRQEVSLEAENNPVKTPMILRKTPTQPTKVASKPNKSPKKEATKQGATALDYGLWKGTLSGNKVCFALENAGTAIRQTRRICFLKEEIKGFAERKNQEFSIEQEQGTLLLEGDFSNGKGQGVFKFKPNPSFVKFLENEDRLEIAEEKVLLLFFSQNRQKVY